MKAKAVTRVNDQSHFCYYRVQWFETTRIFLWKLAAVWKCKVSSSYKLDTKLNWLIYIEALKDKNKIFVQVFKY